MDQLLLAVGRSDTDAFAELYDASAPRVHGLALSVLGDPQRAEELVRDLFLEVWRTAGDFDPTQGSALAWIVALTHRRAVERVRSAPSTGGVVLGRSAHLAGDRVRAALDSLSPSTRDAVELAWLGGHTHAEASRLAGIPLGVAAARMREGLHHLMAPREVETA